VHGVGKGRRVLVAAATAVTLALSAAACGSSSSGAQSTKAASHSSGSESASGATKTIMWFDFVPRGFNDVTRAWTNGVLAGAKAVGPHFALVLKAEGQAVSDPATYCNFIQSAVVSHPAGIIVVPNDAAGMKTCLERVVESGIPVFVMNQDVQGMTDKVGFAGGSYISAGQIAARWLLQQQATGKLTSNEVGVVRSTPGITTTDDGYNGFVSALRGSNLSVVGTVQPAAVSTAGAESAASNLLTAHPHLGAIFSVEDAYGLGVARALQNAHRLNVKSISIDATPANIQLMLRHQGISAEIFLNKYQEGLVSVETLAKYLNGQRVPKDQPLPAKLITSTDARAFLKQSAALSK
jgi:ribose transport system substrate-binding protein